MYENAGNGAATAAVEGVLDLRASSAPPPATARAAVTTITLANAPPGRRVHTRLEAVMNEVCAEEKVKRANIHAPKIVISMKPSQLPGPSCCSGGTAHLRHT